MMIGKVLRIGYISREKVLATDDIRTLPVMTSESFVELSEQAAKTTDSDKTRVLADMREILRCA